MAKKKRLKNKKEEKLKCNKKLIGVYFFFDGE